MPWLLELDVDSKWLFSCAMLYLDTTMLCLDSATYFFVGILYVAILVHNIVGSHFVSGMIVFLLGDVGGDRRQLPLIKGILGSKMGLLREIIK